MCETVKEGIGNWRDKRTSNILLYKWWYFVTQCEYVANRAMLDLLRHGTENKILTYLY